MRSHIPHFCFARSFATEEEIRHIFREMSRDPDVTVIAGTTPDEYGNGVMMSVTEAILPRDWSFWRFDKSMALTPPTIGNLAAFSDELFESVLRKKPQGIRITHFCDYNEYFINCRRRLDGEYRVSVSGGRTLTLQQTIHKCRVWSQLPVWRKAVEVNWQSDLTAFRPCIVDKATGEVRDFGFHCRSVKETYDLCRELMAIADRPPATLQWHESITRQQMKDYPQIRKRYSAQRPKWSYTISGTYAKGLDPICRPKSLPASGLHFPLLAKYSKPEFDSGSYVLEIQLDVVHSGDASYLELHTTLGPEALRERTRQFPQVKWEFWRGDPSERWDGDPTPIKIPKLKAAPPLMFMTPLDQEFRCFIEDRVLILFIDWGLFWTEFRDWTSEKTLSKRREMGYTDEELGHLSAIDKIEARFDEIAARYSDWDSIRFWWPEHLADKPAQYAAYWAKRPNLRNVKTLPMKVRGKKLQIPVEFVEPLKCPM